MRRGTPDFRRADTRFRRFADDRRSARQLHDHRQAWQRRDGGRVPRRARAHRPHGGDQGPDSGARRERDRACSASSTRRAPRLSSGIPGIVDVFDCAVDATGRAYIVMENLDGETLADRLAPDGAACRGRRPARSRGRSRRRSRRRTTNGIVHRDLKPENVFLVARSRDARGGGVGQGAGLRDRQAAGGRRVRAADDARGGCSGRRNTWRRSSAGARTRSTSARTSTRSAASCSRC